ncbi:MAG: hypothetical protein DRI84_05860 [Bacteroidetes bacterium]|nr:MAG: hypothetical protein DRI84_05860 [Bacteroidota bacterium]
MRLIIIISILFLVQSQSLAQNGTVKSFYKISQTQGNIPITLSHAFGASSTCIGDINNDGVKDFAIGEIDGVNDGKLHIIFMNVNGSVKSVTTIKSGQSGLPSSFTLPNLDLNNFGMSVDTIGDIDGDGVVDLVTGIEDYHNGTYKGYVFILFMNTDGTIKSYTPIGENISGFVGSLSQTSFGFSVAGIGDLNNDGINDLAVGGYKKDNNKGAVWILFLNSDGTVKSQNLIDKNNIAISNYFSQSLFPNPKFGYSISKLGDLNKDGNVDILVSSIQYKFISGLGSTAILFLNSDGSIQSIKPIDIGTPNFTDTLLCYQDSLNPYNVPIYGSSVMSMGDLNGDFNTDIAISAPRFSDSLCTKCGAVGIFFLDSLGNILSYQRISKGNGNFNANLNQNDDFGGSLSGIGDFNGDQINDILVSSPGNDDGGLNRGAIYILNLNGVPDTSPIKNVNQLSGIKLFPNPTTESIKIEFKTIQNQETQWKIQDLKGVMLKGGKIPINSLSENINIQDLSSGIYIITFQNKNNVFTKKIVIAK